MDRFKVQEELGDGTFGTVFRAIRREDNSEVRSPSRTNLPSILSKPMLPLLLSVWINEWIHHECALLKKGKAMHAVKGVVKRASS